jgi:hypothetical protein
VLKAIEDAIRPDFVAHELSGLWVAPTSLGPMDMNKRRSRNSAWRAPPDVREQVDWREALRRLPEPQAQQPQQHSGGLTWCIVRTPSR